MSVTERGAYAAKGLLALVLVLFSLNTITHDFLCHEELAGVCNPLHWLAPGTGPVLLAASAVSPSPFPRLSAAGTPDIIPGFISDIYHPPD
jgi:hypothetical protein